MSVVLMYTIAVSTLLIPAYSITLKTEPVSWATRVQNNYISRFCKFSTRSGTKKPARLSGPL